VYWYDKLQSNFSAMMAAEKEATEYSGKVVQYSGGGEKWHEWSI
jgi:hypothetical protein